MKLAKETIWHFTCDYCNLWWSFASSDDYEPKDGIFCPHCGKKNKIEEKSSLSFTYSLTNKIFKMKSRYSDTKIEGKCKGKITL